MCFNVPDHPVIRNLESTGWPDGKPPAFPKCPVCGEETDIVCKNKDGEIVGCGECIRVCDAWEEATDQ